MLNYHFDKKLITTRELLKELSISVSKLDYWKTNWRKAGNDCWDMGLRLIGNTALWDPIVFLDWLSKHKLKTYRKINGIRIYSYSLPGILRRKSE